jgi:hypothetical protein
VLLIQQMSSPAKKRVNLYSRVSEIDREAAAYWILRFRGV